MKRIWLLIVAGLIMTTGCIEIISPTAKAPDNQPPVAYIDSISTNRIFQGETVAFSGHGIDPDGDTIAAYRWRSSLDGVISTQASFETDSLSAGKNTIYFSVQDSIGTWSKEIYRDITVIPPGSMVPILHDFHALPKSILEGEPATLYWDVSGADTVTITPDIGYVSANGSIAIYPVQNNVYRLEAVNDAGKTEGTVRIVVNPLQKNILNLYALPDESGSADYCAKTSSKPIVGSTKNCLSSQAFVSFNIESIPTGARITEISLDISHYILHGDPFSILGAMGIFNDQYNKLDTKDFVFTGSFDGWNQINPMVLTHTLPADPFTSATMINVLQNQVDKGNDRFQIRIQFEKMRWYKEPSYRDSFPSSYTSVREDNLEFIPNQLTLLIKYK